MRAKSLALSPMLLRYVPVTVRSTRVHNWIELSEKKQATSVWSGGGHCDETSQGFDFVVGLCDLPLVSCGGGGRHGTALAPFIRGVTARANVVGVDYIREFCIADPGDLPGSGTVLQEQLLSPRNANVSACHARATNRATKRTKKTRTTKGLRLSSHHRDLRALIGNDVAVQSTTALSWRRPSGLPSRPGGADQRLWKTALWFSKMRWPALQARQRQKSTQKLTICAGLSVKLRRSGDRMSRL